MNFSEDWLDLLDSVMQQKGVSSPRGLLTKELLHHTIVVDARKPVLRVQERGLSYKFMAAEAYWILSGSDSVDGIAPYNVNISKFSDDGKTFFGAYGPKIKSQLPYVIHKLVSDKDTRQAGLTIWRESPPYTKDVPCTVAVFFSIRGDVLNAHVFMRSSDIWLGLPYDVFNFSMLIHLVCGELNLAGCPGITPGLVYLTAMSSHLYASNWDKAHICLQTSPSDDIIDLQCTTPIELYRDPEFLLETLKYLRDAGPGNSARWWEL